MLIGLYPLESLTGRPGSKGHPWITWASWNSRTLRTKGNNKEEFGDFFQFIFK